MSQLKPLRKSKGLTQNELADIAGVSLKALQAYEQNARPLEGASVKDVYHIAKALDTTIEDLLELEPLRKDQ